MFWADKIAKKIIESGKYKPYGVDDMKTPSGKIHAGSIKGVVIHELLYKALISQNQKATFMYCINDMDPMDGFPVYLDRERFYKYMGSPFFKIPSPESGFATYSEYFAKEFIGVINEIGCNPNIVWTSNLYAEGKFDKLIKTYLDNTDKIRHLFKEQYKNFKDKEYFPYQPICPSCGKIATTKIYKWDGEYVHFICKEDAVAYTKGCGFEGKVKPEKQNGKLPWKIEWSAHWKILGVTIELSGKDHMTAGGSHEIASKVCEKILNYPTPYAESYEHLLLGGKKMSSSKGIGSSAREVADILPPYLLRFVFTRVDYRETVDFDPIGTMVIPDLFDEYDRCWQAYNTKSDENLSRIFEYSQINKILPENPALFLPRFRDIANYIQHPTVDIAIKFAEMKGSKLSDEEIQILKEREKYALIWIKNYAPDEYRFHMMDQLPIEADSITDKQKEYLVKVIGLLDRFTKPDDLQLSLYNLSKEMEIPAKDAFAAIYLAFLGKKHGPKAAWFLLQYPKDRVIKRLKEASQLKVREGVSNVILNTVSRPDLFTIDEMVKNKYPSVSIGIAVIKNVNIQKSNPILEKEKAEFLNGLKNLTTEDLGKYPELISYRKLYKEMEVDWHSRRPSPEALLRRVVLKKGLYSVNTCVDAYNLVVMKNKVSVGAFDYDHFKFPTILRFPKDSEEILLLGDDKPTKYTSRELAYFDQTGGYNIDFNYRDAQRTAVTEKTNNLWLNVDGIYGVTPEMVQESLKESIELIVKYCGGEVEFEGLVL